NVGAIHGLWTLHGLGLLDGGNKEALSAAAGALDHPSEAVRKNAVNVLPENGSSIRAILDHQMLNDQSSNVRLAALVALAELPESEEAGSGIFNMLSDTTVTNDEWMSRAGALGAAQHAGGFLESAADAGVEGTGMEQEGEPPESLAQIVQLVAEENPDFDQSGDDDGGSEEGELPPGVDASLEVGVTPNILEY